MRLKKYDNTTPVFKKSFAEDGSFVPPKPKAENGYNCFECLSSIKLTKDNYGEYCYLKPGDLIKTIVIGEESFYYDEDK